MGRLCGVVGDEVVTDGVRQRAAQRAVDVVHGLLGQSRIVAADATGLAKFGIQPLDLVAGEPLEREVTDPGGDVAAHMELAGVESAGTKPRLG